MKIRNLLPILVLMLIHIITGIDFINKNSPTYDEAVHLTAGYSYFKTGNFDMNILDHPPFAKLWAAAPLLFYKLEFIPKSHPWRQNMQGNQYRLADYFVYKNRTPAEKLIFSGRAMMLALSAGFLILLFVLVKSIADETSAIFSAFLYVFYSAMVGNAALITTDAPLMFFFFLATFLFWKFLNDAKLITAVLSGVSLGLALSSKFSSIILLLIMIVFIVYFKVFSKLPKRFFAKLLLSLAVAALTLWATYFFSSQYLRYYDGLNYLLKTASERPRATFLMGNYSVGGWWYYFITTFLLKTPIPLIILTAISLFNKKQRQNWLLLYFPVIIYFVVSSFSKIQIGHRHILPIYPFLFCAAGITLADLIHKHKKIGLCTKIFACILAGWFLLDFISVHPWHISYFNQLAGGPKNGHKFLLDSNIDWGQGLKELSLYLRAQNTDEIYFSYFGTGDPNYYGIKYYPVGFVSNLERDGNRIDLTKQPRKFFALSVTNLYANYYADKQIFAWLHNEKPTKTIAHSIFVYDLENKNIRDGFVKFWKNLGNHEEANKIGGLQFPKF